MRFYSTGNHTHRVSLKEAVIRGLAPDGGLYLPETIAELPPGFFDDMARQSFGDVAFTIARALLGNTVPDDALRRIVDHTVGFDAPLVPVTDDVFALELFHGPTLAFKDFGARFMSQLLGYFADREEKEIVILVATSGDTGSAVANGFLGVKGTRVVVLYPAGKVSNLQEKQFTTLGDNITALEVDGTFDDCQRLVKQAFADEELRTRYFLTSANSINIARLIPQTFYYFRGWAQLADKNLPAVFAVPSGNFGNLTAGLIAKRMGLPVDRFVIATNVNDIVPRYLKTSVFNPRPSVTTISNAMDVGNPSNFHRMVALYGDDAGRLRQDVVAYTLTDDRTREVMREVYHQSGYMLDPHGAVAYGALTQFLQESDRRYQGIFLETAHPGKFAEVIRDTLRTEVELPARLAAFLEGTKDTMGIGSEFPDLKKALSRILD